MGLLPEPIVRRNPTLSNPFVRGKVYELAGGDPQQMTGPLNRVLTALASGAVFFGGLTYVGNAPNMMVRSIASRRGVQMPGFFGYMAWSCALLLPVFAVVSALFFA